MFIILHPSLAEGWFLALRFINPTLLPHSLNRSLWLIFPAFSGGDFLEKESFNGFWIQLLWPPPQRGLWHARSGLVVQFWSGRPWLEHPVFVRCNAPLRQANMDQGCHPWRAWIAYIGSKCLVLMVKDKLLLWKSTFFHSSEATRHNTRTMCPMLLLQLHPWLVVWLDKE